MTRRGAQYSLGRRLSWLFAALTLVGFGALSLAIYVVAMLNLSQKADAELARKTDLVRHLVAEASASGDVATMKHKLDEFFIGHSDLQLELYGPSGELAYLSTDRIPAAAMQRRADVELARGVGVAGIAKARIVLDRSADARLLAGLAAMLVVATVLGSAGVSLSGFWLVQRSLAPLRGLADQTRALRIDRLGQRLSLEPAVEELQPWIDQFNELLGRLDYAYRQLEAFNADVAHELRTPLATLISQMEVVLSRPRTAEELHETVGSGLEEVRRLSTIVNDMLFLAHADQGAQVRAATPASLAQEVRQVLDFHEAVLAERALQVRIIGDATVAFDPGLIRRAISNLLANAARYACTGSDVTISIREGVDVVWLEVSNRGPSVPPSALPRIFDRFFRMEVAREDSSINHGLGLAIVAAIARMHGGTVEARSTDQETTIAFSLRTAQGERPSAAARRGLAGFDGGVALGRQKIWTCNGTGSSELPGS